jgi:hypothetical protein
MQDLTEKDEKTIRQFLRNCLDDGFYAFVIEGRTYLLQDADDIDEITKAIKNAKPPVKKYRLEQAKHALEHQLV